MTHRIPGLGYNIEMWAGAEGFLLIFCSCVPTLAPLWDRFVTKKLDSSYGRTPLNKYTPDNSARSKTLGTGSVASSGPYSRLATPSRNGLRSTELKGGSVTELMPTSHLSSYARGDDRMNSGDVESILNHNAK